MDIKLHYQEKGSGYPLILLHGNGEDGSRFRHQIEYFSKEYRVIAIDTRGQGESPRGTAPFTFEQYAQDLLDLLTNTAFSGRIFQVFPMAALRRFCLRLKTQSASISSF